MRFIDFLFFVNGAQQLFPAAVDAAVPIIADRQSVVAGLCGSVGSCIKVRSIDCRSVALLDKGIGHVECQDQFFLPEFILDTESGVDGGRGIALRAAAPVVKRSNIEVPHGCGGIAEVYICVKGAIVLVVIYGAVVGAIVTIKVIQSDIQLEGVGKGITRPGAGGIFRPAANVLKGRIGNAIGLEGRDL